MAVLLIPLSALTDGIDFISYTSRPDTQRVNVVGLGAYFRSQGIAFDGENYYFSSKSTLIKTKSDYRTAVNTNYQAIPDEIKDKYNSKHIGGISYYNGKIYGGLEDSKVFEHPVIGVFDAESLALESAYELTDRDQDGSLAVKKGVPWVAVDSQTGYLYLANHNKRPDKLFVFDVNDNMKQVGEIILRDEVYSIQGGEFIDGSLFVATNDETQAIYKINLTDGTASKILDRNLTSGSEGEGMTVTFKDGSPVIVAIDMGPLFVNAFVREYTTGELL